MPDIDRPIFPADVRAHGRKHAFGVIAREQRFADGGLPFRKQRRQQQGAFDLRAGDPGIHLAADEARRRDANGRMPFTGLDLCAKPPQRLRHALHRALGKGLVAAQGDVCPAAGRQPHQQAHSCAAIAAVAVGSVRLQSSAHADLALADGDVGAQGAHTGGGGKAVFAEQGVGDVRLALGDAVEHDGAVCDRFIAGDGKAALKRAAGAYLHRQGSSNKAR